MPTGMRRNTSVAFASTTHRVRRDYGMLPSTTYVRVNHSMLLSGFGQEARDTLDLIDQLLWVLGPADSGESGFVFFDLDETLITRDTCLIDGLGSTRFVGFETWLVPVC